MKHQLTLETLVHIDRGRAAAAFDQHIKRIVDDMMDRPGDDTARTITLRLKISPLMETNGQVVECNGATGEFEISSGVPTQRTRTLSFGTNKKGHLLFNDESEDDFKQTTIEDHGARPNNEK